MKYFTKRLQRRIEKLTQEQVKSFPIPWQILDSLVGGLTPKSISQNATEINNVLSSAIKCDREQCMRLVTYLMDTNLEKNESDLILAVLIFNQVCLHPGKSDLIYYSRDFFPEGSPTITDIVRLCLGEEQEETRTA
jgi:hypothetical protein